MSSRTLTVLIADAVGSTELFSTLGVDSADTARRALFEGFRSGVAAGGGSLIKTMGDGCLGSFGSAADAVTAAVAMQREVAALRGSTVPGLSLRVGIAVGDVTEEDDDIFGPAVVAASRLCAAAGEHQILATEMVRMLAGDRGGHDYDSVGELVLKGFAQPVAACAVRLNMTEDGRRKLPLALAATPSEIVVGRDAEAEVLLDAYKFASAGQRRAVLVAGEPGVGKTRLVASVARRAFEQGAIVLFGRCEEDVAAAYQPFTEALRGGLAAFDQEAVAAHLAEHGGEIRRLVPAVEGPEPQRAEPSLEESRLFDAMTDLLRRVAAVRPVVLVLDDLHWAAASTIALLRHVLNSPADQRLCIFGTYRDTEVDRTHAVGALLADAHRVEGVERLSLRGLDQQGIHDLMTAASGDALDTEGEALAAAVAERTSGNPFFVNQMLRHLVERGALVQANGRWQLSRALAAVDLPEGVLDVVGRRLSRLTPGTNRALAVAAVCGLEFGVQVLSAVTDAGSPDEVVDGLDEAVRARLLVERAPGHFAFTHAIVRDALLRELTTVKRARLHRSVAEAIRVVYGTNAPLAALAMHSAEAAVLGDTAAAAESAIAAARAARAQADLRGAVATLERALDVIEEIEPVDQAARFDVAASLSECHFSLASFDRRPVDSAADAARRLGSGERMLRVAVARWMTAAGVADPDSIELFRQSLALLSPDQKPFRALALAALAGHRALQNDPAFVDDVALASALIDEVKRDAPNVAAAARFWLVFACLGLPNAAERLRWMEESLGAWDLDDPWWNALEIETEYSGQLGVYYAVAQLTVGNRREYDAERENLRALGLATGNRFLQAQDEIIQATGAMIDGRFDDVIVFANRMVAVVPEDPNFRLSFMAQIGHVAIERGEAADMLPIAEAAHSISPDLPALAAYVARFHYVTGDERAAVKAVGNLLARWDQCARDWTWMVTVPQAVEVVAGAEATEFARVLLDELTPYAGQLAVGGTAVVCLGAIDRYRGMMLTLLGDLDAAIAAFDAALALELSIDGPPFVARTRYWLGRTLTKRGHPGDVERAGGQLREAVGIAESLGMQQLAAHGRELLEALS